MQGYNIVFWEKLLLKRNGSKLWGLISRGGTYFESEWYTKAHVILFSLLISLLGAL